MNIFLVMKKRKLYILKILEFKPYFIAWILGIILIGCEGKKDSATEMKQLINRLAPRLNEIVRFEYLNSVEKNVFELESVNGKVVIRGDNNLSMATGLNYYLKYHCGTSVSWYADDKIQLPDTLPPITGIIRKEARVEKRFFLNYCTFGYSMPWWQWEDWERFIDWMALNGINMPLAITGQEAVWQKVWHQFGLNDDQIRQYFTGPAHLPWHRMSNLDHWGGPLPQSWIDNQLELQKKIVQRERELGMTPVLPAFTGHVPAALKETNPQAKISKLGFWGGFEDKFRSHFLDPLDPLFPRIQKAFLEEMIKQFGTDHIYGADPFNEVEPPSWEPKYLADVAGSIYNSLTQTDPDATWLQMSWVFYFERKHWTNERIEAMLKAVPPDRMILLDYYCENTEVWKMTDSFYGQPYIWCYLGNFGGNTMLAGNLEEVSLNIENTFTNGGPNFYGLGSTLEAFDMNPLMYELVFEKVWEDIPDISSWVNHWADRRYGERNEKVRAAWEILLGKVYISPVRLGQATLTNARPTFTGSGNWTTDPTIHYNNSELFNAWEMLVSVKDTHRDSYYFDLTNIGRQFLGNHFFTLREQFTRHYNKRNLDSLKITGSKMIELLDDLDDLLSSQPSLLLGKWIEDARAMGLNDSEADYFEKNARNIITTWGGKTQSLNDYANRSWAGLTSSYYKKRWQLFIEYAISAAKVNKPMDEIEFFKKVTQFEADWVENKDKFNSIPSGNSYLISKQLVDKYRTINVN